MKTYIGVSRVEGTASRQAHVNLPEGTFEREMSKEGFFGPAALLYHRRPPTGWVDWDGPLRPRAFDLMRLEEGCNSPVDAVTFLHNAHCKMRMWRAKGRMDHLVRTAMATNCYSSITELENSTAISGVLMSEPAIT